MPMPDRICMLWASVERYRSMRKTILDDGFQSYLTEGAVLVGEPGIPMLMDMQNVQIPKGMIPFSKARTCKDKRQFVHFYEHDKEFSRVLTATTKYLPLLQEFDGIITPDCTMMINQSKCLQQTNTYFNRAVGYYCQRNGISVVVNVRWSDESSFTYCFLGIPKGSIVCVSTHGCLRSREQKRMFNRGMHAMLEAIKPRVVLVHGYMPDDVFGEFRGQVEMYRYPSLFEHTHKKEEGV